MLLPAHHNVALGGMGTGAILGLSSMSSGRLGGSALVLEVMALLSATDLSDFLSDASDDRGLDENQLRGERLDRRADLEDGFDLSMS